MPSSQREESISLDLCAGAHRDSPELMRQSALIMAAAAAAERSWNAPYPPAPQVRDLAPFISIQTDSRGALIRVRVCVRMDNQINIQCVVIRVVIK